MNRKAISLFFALVLIGGSPGSSALAQKSTAATAQDNNTDAEHYFKQYLEGCETNEIRCLWFLQDNSKVGMVMTLNLTEDTVFTVRDVYNWAHQASHTKQLTDSQVNSLKKVVNDLPASDKNATFERSVLVSIRKSTRAEVFQYDRRHAPASIQRIYEIGGGYLDRSANN